MDVTLTHCLLSQRHLCIQLHLCAAPTQYGEDTDLLMESMIFGPQPKLLGL